MNHELDLRENDEWAKIGKAAGSKAKIENSFPLHKGEATEVLYNDQTTNSSKTTNETWRQIKRWNIDINETWGRRENSNNPRLNENINEMYRMRLLIMISHWL